MSVIFCSILCPGFYFVLFSIYLLDVEVCRVKWLLLHLKTFLTQM